MTEEIYEPSEIIGKFICICYFLRKDGKFVSRVSKEHAV
jgi:hypothetical protein